jgi:putative DNA primase/helicase
MGGYAVQAPFSTFAAHANSIPNDVAMLAGARLVVTVEAEHGSKLNEARVKALTGGDPITARFLHREFFTFDPQCKLWVGLNHLPHITGDDMGIWRRVLYIPFTVSFEGRQDKRLEEKLRAELPGILTWCVRGCLEWQQRGLERPEKVDAMRDEYRRHEDPVYDFLDSLPHGDGTVKATELYQAFVEWWHETHGDRPPSQRKFGESLRAKGIRKVRRADGYYYVRQR